MFSTLSKVETEALLVDLEVFRAAVGFITNAERLDSPIPIQIFAFSRRADFNEFGGTRNIGGYIKPSLRSYTIVLGKSRAMSHRDILYHEYTHFLLRNDRDMILPQWYDEGFVDFMATVERTEDKLIVGKPHPVRASWLVGDRPIPVERLLEPRVMGTLDDEDRARFYARAWLLVHFLSSDYQDPSGLSFGHRFTKYLAAREEGMPPNHALEHAWGLTLRQLERELDGKNLHIWGLPLSKLEYSDRVETRTVPPPEMARHLGFLSLTGFDLEAARRLFQVALAFDPTDARATAGLADTYKFEARVEEAKPLFDRAIALAPRDVLNRLDHAEFWLSRGVESEDPDRKQEFLARARKESAEILEDEPDNAEALWVYAVSNAAVAGSDLTRTTRALERAIEILPSDRQILFSLLEAYTSAGREKERRRVAQRLISTAHSNREVARIKQFLDQSSSTAPE